MSPIVSDFNDVAQEGDLKRLTQLIEQGAVKNQECGEYSETALAVAATNNHLDVVRYLVEQGADMGD